jgi:hypothetical protein
MGDLLEDTVLELHPAEMPEGTALGVLPVARNKGRIEIGRSGTVPAEALPLPLPAFESVMHVAEHHKWDGTTPANAVDR